MIRIGSLAIDLDGRQLLRDGIPLAVGSRAFDLLCVLVEARGQIVSKTDLFSRVWPTTVVEENNLHVQLSRLRHLLGDSGTLLQTVSGRGYRFAIPTTNYGLPSPQAEAVNGETSAGERRIPNNLPMISSEIIGREDSISGITEALKLSKHVTLVGAGGIGKTRLGIEVARRAMDLYADGVYVISLASATDYEGVLNAASSALGINPADGPLSLARLSEELVGLQMLFVVDNCEQVARPAAELTKVLGAVSDGARVIATSRGPIGAANERFYRVEPLLVPPQTVFNEEAEKCAAVQLFYSHARGLDALFQSDERSHALIHMICLRLDGIPLAIELAAARASVVGIETLAKRLDDRFRVLTGGSRSALPRHQTLRATFDWSYALLEDNERAVLRRLSIFPTGFTMPAAVAVAAGPSLDEYAVLAAVSGLVEKSLIVRSTGVDKLAYGMLQTTRAYAQEKLDHNGERRQTRLNHANYFSGLLGDVANADGIRTDRLWQRDMRDLLDDLRAALTWAVSSEGDAEAAQTLSVSLVWLLFELSYVDECCIWARRSLEALESQSKVNRSALMRSRLYLNAAYAAALVYVQGPVEQTVKVWSEVLTLSIALGDVALEGRALWGMWNACQSSGAIHSALNFAKRFAILDAQPSRTGSGEPASNATVGALGQRLMGISSHYAGDQSEAYRALKRFLKVANGVRTWIPLGRSIDQHVVASATFARVLWIKGEREAALQISERCVTEASSQDQAIVTCYVLIEASIPIALLSSDRKRASEAISLLHETSTRVGLAVARACSRAFNAYLLSLDDATGGRLSELSAAIADMDALGMGSHAPMLAARYAKLQDLSGKHDEALSTIANALERCEENGNMWFASELHRIRGELLREDLTQSGAPSTQKTALTAERCFVNALEISSNQGALSLHLRAALSFARLAHTQGRYAEACNCLEQVLLILPENCHWPELVEVAAMLRLAREFHMSFQLDAVARNIPNTSPSSDGAEIESELTELTLTRMLQVYQLD